MIVPQSSRQRTKVKGTLTPFIIIVLYIDLRAGGSGAEDGSSGTVLGRLVQLTYRYSHCSVPSFFLTELFLMAWLLLLSVLCSLHPFLTVL